MPERLMKEWYPPGEVYFDYETALWLVNNLSSLREGRWPPDASRYIDIHGKGGKSPFAAPIEYAAEITSRMERCGTDGLILLALECWRESEEALAKYFRMPAWSVTKRARRALYYIASGSARRWHKTKKREAETYKEFKARKRK